MSSQASLTNVLPTTEALLDLNSFLRNGCAAAQCYPSFVTSSALFAGTATMAGAYKLIQESNLGYTHAVENNDAEGLAQARIHHAMGYFLGFLGLGQFGATLPSCFDLPLNTFGWQAPELMIQGGKYFELLAGGFTLLLSLALAISVYCDWSKTSAFRAGLQGALQNPANKAETLKALNFLHAQFVLTEAETEEFVNFQLAPENIRPIAEKMLNVKINSVTRQLDEATAEKVMGALDELIANVTADEPGAIAAAQALIRKVDQVCFKKRVQQITKLACSAIMTAGTYTGLTLTGPVAPILFAVNAAFFLSLDSNWLHNKISNRLYT